MKKTLLLCVCICVAVVGFVQAQCTPSLTGPYGSIVPETTIDLPHAIVESAYSTDIQVFVPADTLYNSVTVTITNFTVTSITGVPPGFSWTTYPAGGVFPGNSPGCIHFSAAAPNMSMVGTYPMIVYITANVVIPIIGPYAVPDTARGYRIVVDSTASAVVMLDETRFELGQNTPNPFVGTSEINFTTPTSGKVDFTVYNMLGSVVMRKTIDARSGNNQIFVSSKELNSGIYMYSISNGSATLTKRMIIAKK